jgi:phage shock protein C
MEDRMKKRFRLDKGKGMLLGVCSGIADFTGWDVTLIRIGAVVVTFLGGFPWTVIGYVATAWVAKPSEATISSFGANAPKFGATGRSGESTRRVEDVESYVASSNEKLAREIEELR